MQLTVHKRKTWRLSAIILAVLAAVSIPLAIQLRSASAVATSATINGSTRAIDGTNTWRGTNQMIMYTYSSSQTSVPTAMSNQWGIEVAVSASGVITAKNDRLSSGSTTGTPIPVNGYVLSGHGWGTSTSGYTWLLQNATVGATVNLNGQTPTQPPSDFNSDGVKLAAPAVTVNGSNVTYNWTVQTNKSVTFRYLQVAVRPGDRDTGFNNNTTVNGTRSFTSTHSLPNGTYTAFTAYYLTSTNKWVNGPSVEFTVGGSAPSDTTAPSVSVTAPSNNTTVTKGDVVNVAANASDNVGVSRVEFVIDGSVAGTDTSAPYTYDWSTSGVNTGAHTIVAKAYDAAGNTATSGTVNVTVDAPVVPTVTATATMTSDSQAKLSWTTTGGTNPTQWTVGRDGIDAGGYGAWSENVPGDRREHVFNYLRPGDTYTLTVSASDGRSAQAIITVPTPTPTDTTAPTTNITAPSNNSSAVIGDTVAIAANASDNVGVTKVEFLVNGTVTNTDTSAPYTYAWDTAGTSAGNYTLTTRAYDAAGNIGTSAAVTVALTSPQQPTVTASATANGDQATLFWTTTGGTDPVEWTVGRDGVDTDGYGAWSENVPGDRRSHTFNYLRAGDTYTLTVSASDGRSATAVITMPTAPNPPADTTAPSVSLTAPSNNSSATVGSTVTLSANASDNVGVAKVEFLVNGSVVNTDTTSPYSFAWNTTGRTAGSYTITARAYDAANNATTSSATTINLTSTTPPATGDWLSGVATVENGNGADPAKYFGDWRGTPIEIGQTWPHTPDVWGINPSVANSWSGWQGPISLSYTPGPDWKGLQGWRSYAAIARGDMDAWWRAAAKQTKEFRQGKDTTYVSPFYEYNGDWMFYSVSRTTQGMADFRAAWERVAAIWRQEFPGVRMVLPAACARDVPQAMMPAQNSYDHIGCTIYNAWPWQANGGEAVRLLEVGRQRALANGKSLVITEWANSANGSVPGGGGDGPGFIQAFHSYFTQHSGTGPGQLEFETFFNIDGYDLDHILLRRNGSQVIVNPTQPQTAAKYQQLF